MLAASLGLLLAGCSTSQTADTADARPDPRQGDEVRQVCFTSQIRNWRENDRRSIIIERSLRDEYKLDLIGTCQPDQAFLNVGLISRGGGSCLSAGDQLVTDAQFDGSCSIRAIHKWNKDAPTSTPAAGEH
jgi:hypothetical protein